MNYFIVNPNSRSGKGYKIWENILYHLKNENIQFEVYFTSLEHNGMHVAKDITKNNLECSITAIGGDGTVNEVINGIKDLSNVTFSYIPTGSSNDFARGLCLSQNPQEALNTILNPKIIEEIDIGCVKNLENSRYFSVSCGIGFDAEVCFEALSSKIKNLLNKLKLGKLSYLGIALRRLVLTKPIDISISINKGEFKTYKNVLFLTAMNLPYEGGGFKFCPSASYIDNELDLCIVHNISKLKVLMLLPTAFKGKHTNFKGVTILKCKDIDIKTKNKRAVHTDGESFDYNDNISISCSNSKLKVVTNNKFSVTSDSLI